MKILYINTYAPPNYVGGTERTIDVYFEILSGEHELHLATTDRESCYESYFRLPHSKSRIAIAISNFINLSAYFELKRIIKKIRPDVVHAKNLFLLSPMVWLAVKTSGISEIKLIQTIEGHSLSKNGLKFRVRKNYYRFMSRLVDELTTPTEYTMQQFTAPNWFPNAKKHIVRNAVKFENQSEVEKTSGATLPLKQPNTVRYLFLGQLEEYKGILWLVKCFSEFYKTNSDAELIIAGNGSVKDKLTAYSNGVDGITYIGWVDKAQKNEVIFSADILLMTTIPSLVEESSPMVIIESYAHGKPVIATKSGGAAEMVIHTKTGYLLDGETDEELIKALEFFKIEENRNKMSERIEAELEKYSYHTQKMKLLSIYARK